VEISEFLPLPAVLNSTPDPVREFIYSALRLKALQQLYTEARCRSGEALSQNVLDTLQISIDVSDGDLARIPKQGPVIAVANHPFGLLDGMVLDSVLLRVRPDIKILTNAILCQLRELKERFIPIGVIDVKSSSENVKSVRQVISWLRKGNGVAMFPAGEVSHWNSRHRRVTDGPWNSLGVRCARHEKAAIIPVFFAGGNSLLFQVAGLLHPNLRTIRLPGELLNKRGYKVEVRVGTPILPDELPADDQRATAYIRARTYMLGHRNTTRLPLRPPLQTLPIKPRTSILQTTEGIEHEIAGLEAKGCKVFENETYAIYKEQGEQIPALLRGLGRLRELTFRNVGEGTGKALDVDEWDRHYTHLILWHKTHSAIAGSYRLAWTQDILPKTGVKGLYTSTLFRYSPEFFARLGPAIELGRSFICPEYQKDYAPLLLLWQAIARCVARQPDAHVLFGAVSISAYYSEASRELMVQFLKKQCFRQDLATWVTSKQPFRSRLIRNEEIRAITESFSKIDDLPIGDIDNVDGVPILLRQYLRLGGRVAAFNVDSKFSNALDGLLILDLRDTAPKLLAKYMGAEQSQAFLEHVRLAATA
jgi:putative hemolysin